MDRHRSHIGAALVKAAERQDAAEDALADDLLAQARKLNRMVWEALEAARGIEPRDWAALAVMLQKQLVLQATLLERAVQAPDGAVVYSWHRSSAREPKVAPAIAQRH